MTALCRELECKVEKLKYKKCEVMQPRIKKYPNFQHMKKLSWISPNHVLQSLLIYTVYHELVKNNKGGGGLIHFLPLKRVGDIEREGFNFNRGFMVTLQISGWFWVLYQMPGSFLS